MESLIRKHVPAAAADLAAIASQPPPPAPSSMRVPSMRKPASTRTPQSQKVWAAATASDADAEPLPPSIRADRDIELRVSGAQHVETGHEYLDTHNSNNCNIYLLLLMKGAICSLIAWPRHEQNMMISLFLKNHLSSPIAAIRLLASVSDRDRHYECELADSLRSGGSSMIRSARLSSAAPLRRALVCDDGDVCDDVHDATGYVPMRDGGSGSD